MQSTVTCIYCGEVLTESTEEAHVFPGGLGGRLKSAKYCCTQCNHDVSVVESELCDRLRQPSALVGGFDRRNKPVSAVVDFAGRPWQATRGRLMAKAPPPRREGNSLIVPLAADVEEQVRVIASILRSRGWPPEALIDGRFTFVPGEPDPPPVDAPLETTFKLGDEITKRAIVKIAVELVGYFDVSLGRHPALSETRRFVKFGTDVPFMKLETEGDASGLWSECNRNWNAVPFKHAVEAWTFAGSLHYRVTLFSGLRFGGLLGTGTAHPFAALYVFDVRKPAHSDALCRRRDGTAPPIWTKDVDDKEVSAAMRHFEEETKRIYGERPSYSPPKEADAADLCERVRARMNRTKKS
jgi:hypothetical protein